MSRLPYGPWDDRYYKPDDSPWTKLSTINEFLEAGEPVPNYLAKWLGDAIVHCGADPDALLRRLDLKAPKGRPAHIYGKRAWLKWGRRIFELEGAGHTAEEAIIAVKLETAQLFGSEVSRSQLQKWRNTFENARNP